MTTSPSPAFTDALENAVFGDERLSKRLVTIVNRLSEKPNMSIPAAMSDRAEMEAAYRFFDNESVTPEAILAPHIAATRERIRRTKVALLVQDTTEIDVTRPQQQVEGVGPMTSNSRFGMFYHPLFAFDQEGLPLGTLWAKCWARERIETELSAAQKRKKLKETPIEEKESYRWIEGFSAARDTANSCPQTQCVCIADSEADVYEQFVEAINSPSERQLHLLVRLCHDRALGEKGSSVLTAVGASPCLYTHQIDVGRRASPFKGKKFTGKERPRHVPRTARTAMMQVRATQVTLRPPQRHDRMLPPVTLNVVLVEESTPPAGETPVQWILITTLPIDEIDQVKDIVHYYSIRWQIEVYFRTLKSGCRIEERYFERRGRLHNCLAVYAIVAWEIFYLCRLSQECPDLSCEVIFEPNEWKPVYLTVRRGKLPVAPPTINEITRMIASLGGYVIRRSTRPGTQTLWFGLQRMNDLSTAWLTFGPESECSNFFSQRTCVVR